MSKQYIAHYSQTYKPPFQPNYIYMRYICARIIAILFVLACARCGLQEIGQRFVSGIEANPTFSLKTSSGLGMDCLKISNYSGVVFGVFHQVNQSTHYSQLYVARLDESTNKWVGSQKLSQRGSQGTIFTLQNEQGIFISYQLENHGKGNRVALRYYESLQNLLINHYWYQYQLSSKVGASNVVNVGTPSVENVTLTLREYQKQFNQYFIWIRFHYSPDGSHDYPGYGYINVKPLRDFTKGGQWVGGSVENYQDWRGSVDTDVQGMLKQAGCSGKIGQRDSFRVQGHLYYLFECNINPSFDWKSWRIFILSLEQKKARQLPLILGGAMDFANPHISAYQSGGKANRFVVTVFVPSEAIGPQTSATPGQCLFYTTI